MKCIRVACTLNIPHYTLHGHASAYIIIQIHHTCTHVNTVTEYTHACTCARIHAQYVACGKHHEFLANISWWNNYVTRTWTILSSPRGHVIDLLQLHEQRLRSVLSEVLSQPERGLFGEERAGSKPTDQRWIPWKRVGWMILFSRLTEGSLRRWRRGGSTLWAHP